jgi:ssDNA-binding replication factor A large subunit
VLGEVRVQFGTDDTDFLVGMDHCFAVAGALAEDRSREQ